MRQVHVLDFNSPHVYLSALVVIGKEVGVEVSVNFPKSRMLVVESYTGDVRGLQEYLWRVRTDAQQVGRCAIITTQLSVGCQFSDVSHCTVADIAIRVLVDGSCIVDKSRSTSSQHLRAQIHRFEQQEGY